MGTQMSMFLKCRAAEVGLLAEIHAKISQGKARLAARVGERESDAVLRLILETLGQACSQKDVESRYNLSKVIGDVHVNFLIHFCIVWVDFKTITISNKCIQALTIPPINCRWLKICLLCDNYVTVDPNTKVGSKGIADN